MTDRQSLSTRFLRQAGWGDAAIRNLAGDASNRRYLRLFQNGERAVLMDAPPEKGEDVRPFVKIAHLLQSQGFSAPDIVAEDENAGFLLLEDLGDDLFARVVLEQPELEQTLYRAATDVLVELHAADLQEGLEPYDPDLMANLSGLAFDWYAAGATGKDFGEAKAAFAKEFSAKLLELDHLSAVLIQRDYHAENLIWLPSRQGTARVGLLDFQDAMAGHPAYDLVSLLQDARRDVPAHIEEEMIQRYVTAKGLDREVFSAAYALIGLQRNLRIIGVFARLCLRDSKAHYVDLIPRVWRHMTHDLKMVNSTYLETVLLENLPFPDDETCETLRQKCGTLQTL